MTSQAISEVHLPRIAIAFCTQCKWNLRAAYYAQELLQTFSITLGEVSLIPVTGGIFTVTLYTKSTHTSSSSQSDSTGDRSGPEHVQSTLIWDRKAEGGFPETKELKNRVRNVVEPNRDLGHIDRSLKKGKDEDGNGVAKEGETVDGKESPNKGGAVDGEEDTARVVNGKEECDDCK